MPEYNYFIEGLIISNAIMAFLSGFLGSSEIIS